MGEAQWTTIESDPVVFTELIKQFGATGVQVEELWNLDGEGSDPNKTLHGLIFLFKWVKDEEPAGSLVQDSRLDKIYFAKQVIPNACATQAILNLLLNCRHSDLQLGSELTKFKEFTMSFDPKMRGLAISNSQTIRAAHNSMASQTLFEFESKNQSSESDAYHFVTYVPIDGRLYELDGLKEGPLDLGAVPQDADWMEVAKPIIMKRMKTYDEGEIHFNLLSVVTERRVVYERRLRELQAASSDLAANQFEIDRLKELLEIDAAERKKHAVEMVRRRHNYLPFIVELLRMLGEKGMLTKVYEDARARAAAAASKKTAK